MRCCAANANGRYRQRGAALVLGIVVIGFGVLVWRERTSLVQLLMAQQALDQATHAAALSAAQHHARLLNAHALLNRTIMAHQVAMAHLLTIASAENMRYTMARQFMKRNPPVFLIRMMFGFQHAAAYAAACQGPAGLTDAGVRALHSAFKAHDKWLQEDLSKAQATLLRDVQTRTREIVQDVLQRNLRRDVHGSVALEVSVQNPAGLLSRLKKDQQALVWKPWFDEVMASDQYLKHRNETRFAWLRPNPKCPLMFHELRRRGQTSLPLDGAWQSTDTLSFHSQRGAKVVLCFWREYPMGWSNISSAAQAGQTGSHDRFYELVDQVPFSFQRIGFLNWVAGNHVLIDLLLGRRNMIADGWAFRNRLHWLRGNWARPYILHESAPIQTMVHVKQSLSSLKQQSPLVGFRISGLLNNPMNWGQAISAQSAAELHYERYTPSSDGRGEQANVFQPYWGARNVPVSP